MAILRSVVDVNNGNAGWTKSDVLDALETVFANLGWHGGSASSGVPQAVLSPGNKSWGTPYNFDRVEIPRISLRQAVVHKHSAVRHDDPSAFQH